MLLHIYFSTFLQNGDVLVPANPHPSGKWPFKRRERVYIYVTICFPWPYTIHTAYAHGTILPVCVESAFKHKTTNQPTIDLTSASINCWALCTLVVGSLIHICNAVFKCCCCMLCAVIAASEFFLCPTTTCLPDHRRLISCLNLHSCRPNSRCLFHHPALLQPSVLMLLLPRLIHCPAHSMFNILFGFPLLLCLSLCLSRSPF